MTRKSQSVRYLLAAAAVLALVMGVANWRQRSTVHLATDGVLWSESAIGLVASEIAAGGPGALAGLAPGDVLYTLETSGSAAQPRTLQDYARQLHDRLPGTTLGYAVVREGVPLRLNITLAEQFASSPLPIILASIGVFYLLLGIWVLWRRLDNPRAPLFVLYAVSSFILFAFSYSGRFDALDWSVYWLDVAAMLLQPALFAHLCLTYWTAAAPPGTPQSLSTPRNIRFGIYASAGLLSVIHIGFALGTLRSTSAPLADSRWWMDRLETGYLAAMYMLGTALLASALKSTRSQLVWKQLVWVLGGAALALGPFTTIYAIPYFAGVVPTAWMSLSAVSLIALPSAMAYAMARHRLLDVDAAIGRGAAWTLATAVLLGAYLGLAALAGEFFRRTIPDAGTIGLLGAVIATGLLLRPLQSWFQRRIDLSFLRNRYDYRLSVLQLGQQLGQHTEREQMAQSLIEPLGDLLELERAAVFVPDGNGQFSVLAECGAELDLEAVPLTDLTTARAAAGEVSNSAAPDLGFLGLLEDAHTSADGVSRPRAGRRDWLHFTGWDLTGANHGASHEDLSGAGSLAEFDQQLWDHAEWRRSIAEMRMPYYFPCRAKGRLVAVLGIGHTTGGELLSEQDEALIETLCGYLALAMESGSLLESLTEKAQQYSDLQQFSENILESINVGVLAVNLDDRVEAINTPLELMVSMPFHQSRGRALKEVLPADLFTEYERCKQDMGVHAINRYRVVGDLERPPGHSQSELYGRPERILNIAIAPLLSRNCECIGRLLVFDDVTDRITLESQLAQADRLSSIGLLAAGVAHEVNTPLTVISTQAQMLEKMLARQNENLAAKKGGEPASTGAETTERTAKILERIISQTFRASEIVNSLLKFSRSSLSSGAGTNAATLSEVPAFTPIELNQIIRETILLVEHPLRVAHIETETHLEPGLAHISGHVGKLQQVLLNLILNARDAMPRGGRLRLTTWTDGDTVRVEVQDTGVGIAPENLARIYDPFFTTKGPGKAAGRDPATGTGLGLAVTYGIMQEHSGAILVESKPGAGTRFELQFPVLRTAVHA